MVTDKNIAINCGRLPHLIFSNVEHPTDVMDSRTLTSSSSIACTNNFPSIPTDARLTVNTPANDPEPVARIHINPYTIDGKVRIANNKNLVNHDTGFGTILDVAKKANGTDNIAPIIVPKKAIANVSTSR